MRLPKLDDRLRAIAWAVVGLTVWVLSIFFLLGEPESLVARIFVGGVSFVAGAACVAVAVLYWIMWSSRGDHGG